MRIKTQTLAIIALMAAFVFLATIIHIPTGPATYFNLSEVVVFTSAILFGPLVGGLSGGIGAALADMLLGFALPWAPISFIIKGLEGLIIGLLARILPKNLLGESLAILATFPLMIGGYTISTGLIYGWPAALIELYTDIVQCATGLALSLPLTYALRKTKVLER